MVKEITSQVDKFLNLEETIDLNKKLPECKKTQKKPFADGFSFTPNKAYT